MSSEEEEATNQLNSFITLLITQGSDSFDETGFDPHHLIILKELIRLVQQATRESKMLQEERQEMEKQIREKFQENKELRERMQMFEEEYENLKILMSNQEQQNEDNLKEISLSSSSMLEELSCELKQEKQSRHEFYHLKKQYKAVKREVSRLESFAFHLKKQNEDLNSQLANQIKSNEHIESLNQQICHETEQQKAIIQSLTEINQNLMERISEFEYAEFHQQVKNEISQPTHTKLSINEVDRIDNLKRLREIEEGFEYEGQFRLPEQQQGRVSDSDSISNWDEVSLRVEKQHKKTGGQQETRSNEKQDQFNLDQIWHPNISFTDFKKAASREFIVSKVQSQVNLIFAAEGTRQRSRTNMTVTPFFESGVPQVSEQRKESSNEKEANRAKKRIVKLEEEVRFLQEQNMEKMYQITEMEGELELIGDRKNQEYHSLELELQASNEVIKKLNQRMKKTQIEHSEQIMLCKKKMKEKTEVFKDKFEKLSKICLHYEKTIANYEGQKVVVANSEIRPRRNSSQGKFKIGIQKGTQTQKDQDQEIVQIKTEPFSYHKSSLAVQNEGVQMSEKNSQTDATNVEEKTSQYARTRLAESSLKGYFEQRQCQTNWFKRIQAQSNWEFEQDSNCIGTMMEAPETQSSETNTDGTAREDKAIMTEWFLLKNYLDSIVNQDESLVRNQRLKKSQSFISLNAKIDKIRKTHILEKQDLRSSILAEKQSMGSLKEKQGRNVRKGDPPFVLKLTKILESSFFLNSEMEVVKQNISLSKFEEREGKKEDELNYFIQNLHSDKKVKYFLVQVSDSAQRDKDLFLIWRSGLLSSKMETGIYMSKQRKKLSDPGFCVLGNCEIVIEQEKISVRRAGKRNFFKGNFPDGDWLISRILGQGQF